MWQHLRLSSLGVIDEAELELAEGLTVITGETGAGKTMLVTALGLLRGERADSGVVRAGEPHARVEASVRVDDDAVRRLVDEAGGDLGDGELVLGRVVSDKGRSRAFAGGAMVPAGVLAQITESLVAVHGQSDQHRLVRPEAQREALDRFAGETVAELLSEYRPAYQRLRDIENELAQLTEQAQERRRELDLLTHGIAEVDAVAPEPDEDAALVAEESRLVHAESLVRAAQFAHDVLAGGLDESAGSRDGVAAAQSALTEVAGKDPQLDALGVRVAELSVLIDDVAGELAGYGHTVEIDPARLAVVQERRAALTSLQRKYGPEIGDVLAWADQARRRIGALDHDDTLIADLTDERSRVSDRVRDLAEQISAVRREAATRLSARVSDELTALAMASARLVVEVGALRDGQLGPHGGDHVEFLFSANSGSQLRPVAKGASGGELSRLMLGLEVVLADRGATPTMIFDEVDAGIGGAAALEVGRRLALLARQVQVLAVTHLPQVAAFADQHVHVRKSDDGTVTSSSVVTLDSTARVSELARMLAGQDDSEAARAHATELLQQAREQTGLLA